MTAKQRAPEGESTEPLTLFVTGVDPKAQLTLRLTRPTLLLTLEASAVEVTRISGDAGARLVVDRTRALLAPKRTTLSIRSRSPGHRIAVLGFGDALVSEVVRRFKELGLDRARLSAWLTRTELLSRTVWVHEIVHRYVFERHALGNQDNLATKFLAVEILKELYFLLRDRDEGADRASAGQKYSPVVERAMAYIEAHLFEPCGLHALARESGASESTLLRCFRRELGSRPGEYWRMRRLDEALVLLRLGRYSIGEVATLAGYENATSFGFAFRSRFGASPSAFRKKRATKPAP